MAVKFSPKIFAIECWNVWDCFRAAQDYVEDWFCVLGLMSSGFVVCLVFGVVFGQIMEVENGLNRDWFRGLLRLDDALLN